MHGSRQGEQLKPNSFLQGAIALLVAGFVLSCGGEDESVDSAAIKQHRSTTAAPGKAAQEAKNRLAKDAADKESADKIKVRKLTETAFIPDATRRDPFMPYIEVLVASSKKNRTVQREVKLDQYDVSDLRLIGIITNIGDPRAMVTTPDQTGFVLRRNDYVGRADFVKTGNDGDVIQVNWRVARIHGTGNEEERGIYLVRDDPTTTKGIDVTRFIPLHPVR